MNTPENPTGIGRFWRWLLIADGILILCVCLAALAWLVPDLIRRYMPRHASRTVLRQGPIVGEKKEDAVTRGVAIQDIRLIPPRQIPRTDTWVIEIQQRDLEQEKTIGIRAMSASDIPAFAPHHKPPEFEGIAGRSTVNLLFYSETDPEGHLLFDRQALIVGLLMPHHHHVEDPQDYVLYNVVIADGNGDGRLTREDDKSLWMSDLNGRNLTQITPDSLALEGFSFKHDKKQIYIVAWLNPKDRAIPREHWEQALYLFDVEQKKLNRVPLDPGNIQKARALLQQ